ncbi:acyl-CoA thioesterase [Rhizobium lentis]|uniref:acyl-CoA thioesterase n=1 Tax=Rhizobium lentis TaxID=1138194 RepID=UPI001C82CC2C|nr:acyl-CoA thioesterase [Rhizobium lentis]MBX5013669.1 acyl-CoA thioesterase [Rhizobium lentis]
METMKAVAQPWQCDAMNHMNVRHYSAIFDDASSHFVGQLGGGVEELSSAELGWADVRHVVEFRDEVKAGSLLTVSTRVLKIGRTSLTFCHDLKGLNQNLHATMEVVSVMFDLRARGATSLPGNIRAAAEELLALQSI